jgi:CheY-like chemotaxis protein
MCFENRMECVRKLYQRVRVMNVVAAIGALPLLAILLSSGCASSVVPQERGLVLWVDDRPDGNRDETRALHALGLQVVTASSNAQAADLLRTQRFELIISDIRRGEPEPPLAGLELPAVLRRVRADVPAVIYYVSEVEKPYTEEGQPVVSRPEQLLSLVQSHIAVPPRR